MLSFCLRPGIRCWDPVALTAKDVEFTYRPMVDPNQYLFETKGMDWKRNFRKYKYLSLGYTYLGYNLDNPLFSNKLVRQAIDLAIDKEENR